MFETSYYYLARLPSLGGDRGLTNEGTRARNHRDQRPRQAVQRDLIHHNRGFHHSRGGTTRTTVKQRVSALSVALSRGSRLYTRMLCHYQYEPLLILVS